MSVHYMFHTGYGPGDFFALDIDQPDEETVLMMAAAELSAAKQRIRTEEHEG